MSTRASSLAAGASNERTWCLSPSHVSAIAAPSSVRVTVVPTSNRDLPLVSAADTTHAPEHASFATYVTTQDAGDVLVRVVHHGLAIELSSLSNPALSPHRFVFPSPILPNPTVFVHQISELHVILATEHGSLFTLVFSTIDPDFFHHTSSRSWFHEQRCSEHLIGPVHAHDPHSVWIGIENGGLLNLTLRDPAYGGLDDYRERLNRFMSLADMLQAGRKTHITNQGHLDSSPGELRKPRPPKSCVLRLIRHLLRPPVSSRFLRTAC